MKKRLGLLLAAGLISGCATLPEVGAHTATAAAVSPIASDAAAQARGSLATPVADLPAAGICSSPDGPIVTITIYPDIPDPRCTIVRPDQVLRVVNRRADTLQVSLAGLAASLEPGAEHTFDVPFGELLAPGVHRLEVAPCCGAELWLQ